MTVVVLVLFLVRLMFLPVKDAYRVGSYGIQVVGRFVIKHVCIINHLVFVFVTKLFLLYKKLLDSRKEVHFCDSCGVLMMCILPFVWWFNASTLIWIMLHCLWLISILKFGR